MLYFKVTKNLGLRTINLSYVTKTISLPPLSYVKKYLPSYIWLTDRSSIMDIKGFCSIGAIYTVLAGASDGEDIRSVGLPVGSCGMRNLLRVTGSVNEQ